MTKLTEIALLLYPEVHSPSVGGLTDLLKNASSFAQAKALHGLRISHWQVDNGQISKVFDTHPDLENAICMLVIPPSFEAPIEREAAQAYAAWLTQLHSTGVVLCAICAGIFILLETGLLAGRTVTTHWLNNQTVKDRAANVSVDCSQLMIDDNDIMTSAGALSWMDLGLKLLEKIYQGSLMVDFAKYMLIDPPSRQQSYYSNFSPSFSHGDTTIIKIQHWLQTNYDKKITLDLLAGQIALEKRTLLRRFKKATDMTVIEYCQNLRIQKAQTLLETTSLSFESIAWQVGYQDSSSFNKVFTKAIGLTSTEYRKRFRNSSLAVAI